MYLCKFAGERPTGSEHRAQKRLNLQFFFKDDDLENEVTLKVRSRSPKAFQLFILQQLYNTLSLARIHCSIQEITYKTQFWSKIDISKCWYDLENKVGVTKI